MKDFKHCLFVVVFHEDNWDYFLADIRDKFTVGTWQQCAEECQRWSGCTHWTFHKSNIPNFFGIPLLGTCVGCCHLKNGQGIRKPCSYCHSGCV